MSTTITLSRQEYDRVLKLAQSVGWLTRRNDWLNVADECDAVVRLLKEAEARAAAGK